MNALPRVFVALDSVNVRGKESHHFKGEIHSFGCIQAAP
jgi:hypothetical protein